LRYEVLEHPSELRIRVYGKILEELFSNAVLAMGEILQHNAKLQIENANVANSEAAQIESVDINSLLVDFLSEILAKSQISKKVYQVYKFTSFKFNDDEASLEVELIGHPAAHFDEDIKAVTYEDLDIKQIDGIWQTVIVFDI
jgi:SHS2 domain-containing protein